MSCKERTLMDLSRHQFLQLSTGAGAGTAVGTLAGFGVNLTPATTRAQHLRIQDAKVPPSVCPYCAVGCATLVHTIDGKIVNIEGDPCRPHNAGTLYPEGAAIQQKRMRGLGVVAIETQAHI
jgi:formate dehydrogenase major subunit